MKVSLTTLSTKDLATLTRRIINSSKSGNYLIIEEHPLLKKLETQYNFYDGLYNKLSFSGKGVQVESADKYRDGLWGAFKGIVKNNKAVDTLPGYAAAQELWNVIKIHGVDLDRMSYSSQTAQMKKLIDTLEGEEMQKHIATLNILPVYQQMKQSQTDFEAIYAEQVEANTDLRSLPSATAARKDLEQALRAYLNLLEAMSTEDGWTHLYIEINELVKASVNS